MTFNAVEDSRRAEFRVPVVVLWVRTTVAASPLETLEALGIFSQVWRHLNVLFLASRSGDYSHSWRVYR